MKLIALDLDGTTLSSNNEISNENIRAIKRAQQQGHIVMILSGRAPESINSLLNKYNLELPLAGSNGTAVYANGKLLELTSLSPSQNKLALDILEKNYAPYRVYSNKGIYVPTDWEKRVEKSISGMPEEYSQSQFFERMTRNPGKAEGTSFFENVHSLLKEEEIRIQKFFILTLNPNLKTRLWQSLLSVDDVYLTSSSSLNIEVMNGSGNKGNGLKVMADYFNIPLEDTIAIGDQFNDLPMLKVAGLSIAVDNAEDEIKKVCDVVTLSNDENGVAYAIEKYILKK